VVAFVISSPAPSGSRIKRRKPNDVPGATVSSQLQACPSKACTPCVSGKKARPAANWFDGWWSSRQFPGQSPMNQCPDSSCFSIHSRPL
jgi:hypothetical protein